MIQVNLSRPRMFLHCAPCGAWPSGLCCAAQTLGHRINKLSQLIVAEEPVGSSHLLSVIWPPLCPCLYLNLQQEVLMWTSFLFDCGNNE